MSDVSLSRQKIDIDEAARHIQRQIADLDSDYKILVRGMQEINNGHDMLNGTGILPQEVRKIMRKLLNQ